MAENIVNGVDCRFITVVMPVYNCEKFIEAAVRSVMAQTYKNWKLLVINDGSTDSTCSIVQKLSNEDSRINLIHNDGVKGAAGARNLGLDLSDGDYIALVDSDDLWKPDKLEKQLLLAEKTNADIIYCSYGIIDADNKKTCDDFIVSAETSYKSMMIRSVITCSTALLSRKIVDKYRFSYDYYHEDLVFWLQILRDGYKAIGVVDILADYRLLDGSRSSNKIKSAIERWKIFRNCLKEPFFSSLKAIIGYAWYGLKKYKRI